MPRWLVRASEVCLLLFPLKVFFKIIRMSKSYYEHSGWIAGGPSRETLFDSIRLGETVDIEFVMTDKEIVVRSALVISIKRQDLAVIGKNDEWIIELLIAGKYFPKASRKEMKFSWHGSYSTQSRQGRLIGELPVCLIVKS